MAKSQETFNKKEKENQRNKKRKDKLIKKEERKANSKGGGLENMMAYVDAYGRISETPIEKSKKDEVKASSIEIGVPKREEIDTTCTGKVSFFNEQKGYGFIKDLDTQENIFVHIHDLTFTLSENDRVTFEKAKGQKGMKAINVKKA
jgi:cold shock CspA family protein